MYQVGQEVFVSTPYFSSTWSQAIVQKVYSNIVYVRIKCNKRLVSYEYESIRTIEQHVKINKEDG